MRRRIAALTTLVTLFATLLMAGPNARAADDLGDKTLVVWVHLADLDQRGVSALTVQNFPGTFDALVFGELEPRRWMAGSEFFKRSQPDQKTWPAESAGPNDWIKMAVVYEGSTVRIYRDGALTAEYKHQAPPARFGPESIVLMGLRHLEITGPTLRGAINEARIYDHALAAPAIAGLEPGKPSTPAPWAWWTFDEGKAIDRAGRFPEGRLVGKAQIHDGVLMLDGGYLLVGLSAPRSRDDEDWPTYHISVRPQEGVARPYDANGCIWWKGKYHLMYIYQDPTLRNGGHCWGHIESTDLVNWTYLPPALRPEAADADAGTFSGNAFLNADGVPMLCWFGVDTGVCVATAEDASLIHWKKHPNNPIIPMPKPGEPGHGVYRVWDPYLWREGNRYICLLGGNTLPNGKDTLYAMTSPDLVAWKPVGPFYEHPDLSWTTEGEDCSCPDFFKLGDRHVLVCISHKVGARAYVGRFDAEKVRFTPERHFRMNWPGGHFFAPETLLDNQNRRIVWAWVTDPRAMPTQISTGSGVQSLPRVLGLTADGSLTINPPVELQTLRKNPRVLPALTLADGQQVVLESLNGKTMELALTIDPGTAKQVRVAVRRSPDGKEQTGIVYDPARKLLQLDMTRSTTRDDVVYTQGPLDTGGVQTRKGYPNPRDTVDAPFELAPGELLELRIFLDGPMLEVFANGRQCLTQQVFPGQKDSTGFALESTGGQAQVKAIHAWDMAPARFDERK